MRKENNLRDWVGPLRGVEEKGHKTEDCHHGGMNGGGDAEKDKQLHKFSSNMKKALSIDVLKAVSW